ncbi:hypothetical protein QCA50_004324 [Cerrena zonata]|uniref:Uncharacterized protein n=1 Tax=Cerrena zonata TaxID=2478898 RepID=A0AAW0GH64_9APHY
MVDPAITYEKCLVKVSLAYLKDKKHTLENIGTIIIAIDYIDTKISSDALYKKCIKAI